jgi:hypothetical protein
MKRQNFRPYEHHLRHPVDPDKTNAEDLAAANLEIVAAYLEIAAAALLEFAAALLEIAAAALLEFAAALLEIAAAALLEIAAASVDIAAAAYLEIAAASLECAAASLEIAAAAKVPVAAVAVAAEKKTRADPMSETNYHFQPYPWLDHDLEARAAVAERVSGRFQP